MARVAAVSNLRWPYGMALVGGRVGEARHHQAHDVVGPVDQAVVAVGHHRHAARQLAHHDLGDAHDHVEAQGGQSTRRTPWRATSAAAGMAYFILRALLLGGEDPAHHLARLDVSLLAPELRGRAGSARRSRRRGSRRSPPAMRSKRSFQRAMLASRRSTQPAQAQASTCSGVTSLAPRRRARAGSCTPARAAAARRGAGSGCRWRRSRARRPRRPRSRGQGAPRQVGRRAPRARASMVRKARRRRSAS